MLTLFERVGIQIFAVFAIAEKGGAQFDKSRYDHRRLTDVRTQIGQHRKYLVDQL